ncbi:MAG: class I SAM-dependent methyltransferase [Bacteroidetes bacterium]|nr:MAG: class I SAM-dependent methyltransferase [Bacteroidota bacterium]
MFLSTPSNYFLSKPQFLDNPHGWIPHIPLAFWLMEAIKPGILVELGTYSGNSYFAFCQARKTLGLSTRCFAVDTWQGDMHVGNYGEEVYARVEKIHQKEFAPFSTLLRMDFGLALDHFEEGSIDILHIDGTHTYEAARNDFDNWLPKMSRQGIILLHDTEVRRPGFEVWKLMEEIREQYKLVEFPFGEGLAVICAGENPPAPITELIELTKSNPQVIQWFEILGKNILLEKESADFKEQTRKWKQKTARLNVELLKEKIKTKKLQKLLRQNHPNPKL